MMLPTQPTTVSSMQRHVLALPGARMQVLGTNLPAAGGPVQDDRPSPA